jgi:hypothetical protein
VVFYIYIINWSFYSSILSSLCSYSFHSFMMMTAIRINCRQLALRVAFRHGSL